MSATRRLYHLTAEPWWMLIALDGEIISFGEKRRRGLTGGKLGPFTLHSAPVRNEWDQFIDDSVWLTTNPRPVQLWQRPIAGTKPEQKGAIRIEVEAPEAMPWRTYARHHKFPRAYYDALDATGGSESEEWWVTPGPIPSSAWVEVVRTRDGEILWRRHDAA